MRLAAAALTLLVLASLLGAWSPPSSAPAPEADTLADAARTWSSGRAGYLVDTGETLHWNATTIDLDDNLTVAAGGTLRVTDATVRIATHAGLTTHVRIAPGGSVEIHDSRFEANGSRSWVLESWGEATITGSSFHDAGGTADPAAQGLQFVGGNVTLADTNVSSGRGAGLVLDHTNATLDGLTTTVPGDGVRCDESTLWLANGSLDGGRIGLLATDCAVTVRHTSLTDQQLTGISALGGSLSLDNVTIADAQDALQAADLDLSLHAVAITSASAVGLWADGVDLLTWNDVDVSGAGSDGIILSELAAPFTGPSALDQWTDNAGVDLQLTGSWAPAADHPDLTVDLEGWLVADGRAVILEGLDLAAGSAVAGAAGLQVATGASLTLREGSITPLQAGDWGLDLESGGTLVLQEMVLIDPGLLQDDPASAGLTMDAGTLEMVDSDVVVDAGPGLQLAGTAVAVVTNSTFAGGDGLVVDGGELDLTEVAIIGADIGVLLLAGELALDGVSVEQAATGGLFAGDGTTVVSGDLVVEDAGAWGVWLEGATVDAMSVHTWRVNATNGTGLIARDTTVQSRNGDAAWWFENSSGESARCTDSELAYVLHLRDGLEDGLNASGCTIHRVVSFNHLGWDGTMRDGSAVDLLQVVDGQSAGVLGHARWMHDWVLTLVDQHGDPIVGPAVVRLNTSLGEYQEVLLATGSNVLEIVIMEVAYDGANTASGAAWIEVETTAEQGAAVGRAMVSDGSGSPRNLTVTLTVDEAGSSPFDELGGSGSTGWFVFGALGGLVLLLGLLWAVARAPDEASELASLNELAIEAAFAEDEFAAAIDEVEAELPVLPDAATQAEPSAATVDGDVAAALAADLEQPDADTAPPVEPAAAVTSDDGGAADADDPSEEVDA